MNIHAFRAKLLEEIKSGIFQEATKLPPESTLAQQFGVSRTFVRDSLAQLEGEGFISRRHGVGTTINRHVLAVTTRMDLEVEFSDMVREAGAVPSVEIIDIATVNCDETLAQKLGTCVNTPALAVTRIVSGDGIPVIYCVDYISFQIIKDYSYSQEDLGKPIFHFLKKYCDTDISMDLSVVEPMLASERLASYLQVAVGDPIMMVDEIGYDLNGRRALYSEEYYVNRLFKHTVMRRKI